MLSIEHRVTIVYSHYLVKLHLLSLRDEPCNRMPNQSNCYQNIHRRG